MFVGSLDSLDSRGLLAADTNALYAPPGYVLFARQGTLLAQPFDAGKLQLAADPFPITEQVASNVGGAAAFSVSDNGVLTYRTGAGSGEDLQLTWVDRSGKVVETVGAPLPARGIALSGDARHIALHRHEADGGDIWIIDEARGTTTRLTFDTLQHNVSPVWSPDGSRIAFGSLRNGSSGLYVKASSGVTNDEKLLESKDQVVPTDWSPDGRFIVYTIADQKTLSDIWLLPLAGDRRPIPFLQSPLGEGWGQVSPDGRWMAYVSAESGVNHIFVRPFPAGAGKWQISTTSGTWPRWRGDGKELFYMTGGSPTDRLMAVTTKSNGTIFEAGVPRPLFETHYTNLGHISTGGGPYHTFSVSPDGERFLVPILVSAASATSGAPITVVLNWTTAIKR